jgi:hypothetical protein
MAYKIKREKIEKLIRVLNLKKKRGVYETEWGKKTDVGLRETIKNILEIEEE